MDRIEAQRAIATLHSFRFFGLVFILPGVVGNLPEGFATFAAYGDFTTGPLCSRSARGTGLAALRHSTGVLDYCLAGSFRINRRNGISGPTGMYS
jgi:hypothetical protein